MDRDEAPMIRRPFLGPGPLRAFRDRYVAAYGGLSYDLAPGAVGVEPSFLQGAPELEGRRVLVSHRASATTPLWRRPTFSVVALTRLMRHARDRGGEGEVVFSSFDLDDARRARLLADLRDGEPLFLNAAVDRLPDADDAVRRPRFDAAA